MMFWLNEKLWLKIPYVDTIFIQNLQAYQKKKGYSYKVSAPAPKLVKVAPLLKCRHTCEVNAWPVLHQASPCHGRARGSDPG